MTYTYYRAPSLQDVWWTYRLLPGVDCEFIEGAPITARPGTEEDFHERTGCPPWVGHSGNTMSD